jgi:hypothetical protein
MIQKLANGGILNIEDDYDYSGGCETCDYGSRYITEIIFELTSRFVIIKTTEMYEYAIKLGNIIELLTNNTKKMEQMAESEFGPWIKDEIMFAADPDTITLNEVQKE